MRALSDVSLLAATAPAGLDLPAAVGFVLTGAYIAALRSGWNDRWYDELDPGQSYTMWVKFPAPPAEVKSVTLQVPGVPPFEDLAIQDS